MKYIKRHLESIFLKLSDTYPAVLITGPRQTGKTTMLKKLLEQEGRGREYVTLDDLDERQLAKKDPAMFFQLHKPPVFIDEVQYAPELFPYIKIHADKYKDWYGNTGGGRGDFWLTGSQLFKLMDGVQESLAGRVALLHMSPLSQSEIQGVEASPFEPNFEVLSKRQKNITPVTLTEVYERIFKGGMPALVSGENPDRAAFYKSYIGTYLERDVKELSGRIDSLKFHDFITAVAAISGQLVNYKTIADACDIDQTTAKSWLRILETLGIVFYLRPYSNNALKRAVKTPKLYFYDSGLAAYLTKWSSAETLQSGAMSGAILENYVVGEIMKSWQNAGKEPYIYYYRDKDGKEIDVILERDGTLFPVEIKRSVSPDSRLINTFKTIDRTGMKRGTGAIICMAEKLGAVDSENLIVPVGLI